MLVVGLALVSVASLGAGAGPWQSPRLSQAEFSPASLSPWCCSHRACPAFSKFLSHSQALVALGREKRQQAPLRAQKFPGESGHPSEHVLTPRRRSQWQIHPGETLCAPSAGSTPLPRLQQLLRTLPLGLAFQTPEKFRITRLPATFWEFLNVYQHCE